MTLFVISSDTLTYGDLEEYMGHNYGGSEDAYRIYYLEERPWLLSKTIMIITAITCMRWWGLCCSNAGVRDGMLLFELMNERLAGGGSRYGRLHRFFEENRSAYVWPELITASFGEEDSTFISRLSKASNNLDKLSKLFAKGLKRNKLSSKSWRIWPGDTE